MYKISYILHVHYIVQEDLLIWANSEILKVILPPTVTIFRIFCHSQRIPDGTKNEKN